MSHAMQQGTGWLFAKAWHGLGVVDPTLARDVARARLASGVTWTLNARPVSCDGANVDGYRAVARGTDGKVYGFRSGRHVVMQADTWDGTLQEIMASDESTRLDAILSLHNGGLTVATLALGADDVTGCGDTVESYLLTYVDPTWRSAGCALTTERTVCKNTFTMNMGVAGRSGARVAFRPQGDVGSKVALASGMLKAAASARGKTIDTFARLAKTAWTRENLDALTSKLYPATKVGKRQVAKIGAALDAAKVDANPVNLDHLRSLTGAEALESIMLDADAKIGAVSLDDLIAATEAVNSRAKKLIEEAYTDAPGARPGTAWGALNAVTYYTTHERSRTQDAALANAFTANDTLLETILETVSLS